MRVKNQRYRRYFPRRALFTAKCIFATVIKTICPRELDGIDLHPTLCGSRVADLGLGEMVHPALVNSLSSRRRHSMTFIVTRQR